MHYLNRWLEQHVAKMKLPGTIASYEQDVYQPGIEKVRLAEVDPRGGRQRKGPGNFTDHRAVDLGDLWRCLERGR